MLFDINNFEESVGKSYKSSRQPHSPFLLLLCHKNQNDLHLTSQLWYVNQSITGFVLVAICLHFSLHLSWSFDSHASASTIH
jgi:hypothetical protein